LRQARSLGRPEHGEHGYGLDGDEHAAKIGKPSERTSARGLLIRAPSIMKELLNLNAIGGRPCPEHTLNCLTL
jgi:hypothetical protein